MRRTSWRCLALAAVLALSTAAPAFAQGQPVFKASLSSYSVTGEKPQSKIFYHDGSYWAVLRGSSGVALHEFVNGGWRRGQFLDDVLTASGNADVLCDGSHLHILVYSSNPKYFEYTYDAALRVWRLLPGFPVPVPRPSGAETMVLEKDSTGRLWAAAEGNGAVNVYFTTSPDHLAWSSAPVILRTGVYTDDICSLAHFGGDKLGCFWSDQNREEFAFSVHQDGTDPSLWSPKETADFGPGHSDDHISLKADANGRVYALTKDAFDRMQVHRRDTDGTWTTRTDVLDAIGTRGILMLSEAERHAYILYTRWGVTPDRIEYRFAGLDDLQFGSTTVLMAAASSLNNVTGMKQPLPPGSLMAMAEGASMVWWNGWGEPPSPDDSLGARPTDLVAHLVPMPFPAPSRVELAWTPPVADADSSAGDSQADDDSTESRLRGFNVYRLADSGPYMKLNAEPVTAPSYADTALVFGSLCYRVTALDGEDESGPSNSTCVAFYAIPGQPLPAPSGVHVSRIETTASGPSRGAAAYPMDEGSGQELADATGLHHTAVLGTTTVSDKNDPLWTTGVSGGALRFNNMTDRVRVADAPDLDIPGSLSVEAWIQRPRPESSSAGCIVAKGDAGRRNYSLQIDKYSRVEFRWQSAGGITHGAVSTATIADTRWHHVAAVYDREAAEDRIYIDGKLVKRLADSGVPVTNDDPVYIGARLEGKSVKNFFSGSIDLVRIAPGVLYATDFTPPTVYGSGIAEVAVELEWQTLRGIVPAGYNIYASYGGAPAVRLNATPWTSNRFTDRAAPLGSACYQVAAVDSSGLEGQRSEPTCTSSTLGKAVPAGDAVTGLRLDVTPNPFNPETHIRFRLPAAGPVSVVIYNVRGQRVAKLLDAALPAGPHDLHWAGELDGGGTAASGVYFLQLRAEGSDLRRKLVMLK